MWVSKRNWLALQKEMTVLREKEQSKYSGVGYVVTSILPDDPEGVSEVKFQVAYHDWCKLEKSKEWKAFAFLLEKVQKQKIQQ